MIVWNNVNNTHNGSKVIEKNALETYITNLLPCSDYNVRVQAMTEEFGGDWGNTSLRTLDVAPGVVQR